MVGASGGAGETRTNEKPSLVSVPSVRAADPGQKPEASANVRTDEKGASGPFHHSYADFTPGLLLPLTDPPTILTTHHAQQTPTLRGAESPVCARMLQNRPAQPTSRTPRKWRI